MDLILVRHGAAVEATPQTADEDRYLTAEGRSFCQKTAGTIVRAGIGNPVILTSPLRRAVETAAVLAETLRLKNVPARDELRPGFSLPALQRLLKEFQAAPVLILVGHEPDFSHLLSRLLSLSQTVNFKKGSAVKLRELPTGGFSFSWLAAGDKLVRSQEKAFGVVGPQDTKERQQMAHRVNELQELEGVGDVLSQRLAEAGYDTLAKIAAAGEERLRQIPGVNPRLAAAIAKQAGKLSGSAGKTRNVQVAELKEKAAALKEQLQELAREVRDRFQDRLAGPTGQKVEKELLRLLSSLETAGGVLEERVKRGGKALEKAEKRMGKVSTGGLQEIRKGLKKARKSIEKVFTA